MSKRTTEEKVEEIKKLLEGKQTERLASDISYVFIETRPHDPSPYFTNAARVVLRGVITAFMLSAPDRWTMYDVLAALKSKEETLNILNSHEETKAAVKYVDRPDDDVLATLQAFLSPPYEAHF